MRAASPRGWGADGRWRGAQLCWPPAGVLGRGQLSPPGWAQAAASSWARRLLTVALRPCIKPSPSALLEGSAVPAPAGCTRDAAPAAAGAGAQGVTVLPWTSAGTEASFLLCPHSFTAPGRAGAGTGHSTHTAWMAEDAVPASQGHTQGAIAIPTNTSACYCMGVSALQVRKLPSASESFSPVVPLPPCTSSSPKATSLASWPRSARGCGSSPACPSSTGPALAAAQPGAELPGGV